MNFYSKLNNEDKNYPREKGEEDKENKGYEMILKQAEKIAKNLKINLRIPPLSPIDIPICEENPLRNLYISADGEVAPCVYLNPPVSSTTFKRIFCGKRYELKKVSFGNIFNMPFDEIWNNTSYFEFREKFLFRERIYREMLISLIDLDTEKMSRLRSKGLHPPPSPCMICHKMLGF